MMGGFVLQTIQNLLNWSKSQSIWYYSAGAGCCADELLETKSCRYDLERFGCLEQADPQNADLLIVCGAVSLKAAGELRAVYDQMRFPKYVLAIGACVCGGGPFSANLSYSVVPNLEQILPVDVFVPGCPPRPEAIMNGILSLQEKIDGHKKY